MIEEGVQQEGHVRGNSLQPSSSLSDTRKSDYCNKLKAAETDTDDADKELFPRAAFYRRGARR